jgi:dTDP-glucose pyrophosphorylase
METISIHSDACIRDALQKIDRSALGMTVIVSSDGRAEGVVSDGDIRRALLAGAMLDDSVSPFVSREFFSVTPEASRAAVLDLMQARGIRQIPIVDADGRLHGMHTLANILGMVERPNWAVVMAGGKGTRLRPITENIPKPMVCVAGRPILERIVLHLVSYGIRRVFLSVNYLGHMIEGHFGDGHDFGCKIEYLREEKPLGTGGALSLLPESPQEPLLVMNGDLVLHANFDRMLQFHEVGGYDLTMGVRPYTHEIAYGCVEMDGSQVVEIEEKPVLEKRVNAGVYVLSPEAVKQVPKDTLFPITDLFEKALKAGHRCGGYLIEEDWMDIGYPQHLRKANGLP